MKIEGKHNCEHCKESYEWFYQVPQSLGSRLEVEMIPRNKVGISKVGKSREENGYKIPLEANAYCPKCGTLNNINMEEDK